MKVIRKVVRLRLKCKMRKKANKCFSAYIRSAILCY